MSTDAGTEEHRVSDTLLPMPRRIAQLPSLPNQDASTRSCCDAALAAHAEDDDRAAPAGGRLRSAIDNTSQDSRRAQYLTKPSRSGQNWVRRQRVLPWRIRLLPYRWRT